MWKNRRMIIGVMGKWETRKHSGSCSAIELIGSARESRWVETFDMKCMRKVLVLKVTQKIRNRDIKESYGGPRHPEVIW